MPNRRASAKSALLQAQSNLEYVEKAAARQQELLKQGYVAAQDVDQAVSNVKVAKAKVDEAQVNSDKLESQIQLELQKQREAVAQATAELKRAKANTIQDDLKNQDYQAAKQDVAKARAALLEVESMAHQVNQNQAQIDQLQASLSDTERLLKETHIRAPFAGIITKKNVQVGDLVSELSSFSSGTPIFDLQDRRTMRVLLNINEIDAAKLKSGMTADIRVDAMPTHPYHGTVYTVAPAANASTAGSTDSAVKYQVDVRITDAGPELKSGLSARCTIAVDSRKNVLVLPQEYIGSQGDSSYVELYEPNAKPTDKPKQQNIKLGLTTLSKAEIVSGITEGTKVQRPAYKGPDRKGMMQAGPDDQ